MPPRRLWLNSPLPLLFWVGLLSLFFAQVEIQIEGTHGWAAALPTWRVEKHILLDIFWGGRPMTGYHAWIFSFMALVFHLPVFVTGQWHWRLECRMIGCLMIFWIIEDLLWFLLNPAFGWSRFTPQYVPWHHRWVAGFPLDYVIFMAVGTVLVWISYRRPNSSPS
ncbi:MAG: hypothetical protein WAU91_23245 [Desulfatitalea sp.]